MPVTAPRQRHTNSPTGPRRRGARGGRSGARALPQSVRSFVSRFSRAISLSRCACSSRSACARTAPPAASARRTSRAQRRRAGRTPGGWGGGRGDVHLAAGGVLGGGGRDVFIRVGQLQPHLEVRDATCPLSTTGGTRRVHLVRGGGGGGGPRAPPASPTTGSCAAPPCSSRAPAGCVKLSIFKVV